MAIWLFRAGKSGQFETKFLEEGKVFLTWEDLCHNLSQLDSRQELFDLLSNNYDNQKRNTIRNWIGQIWPMAKDMQVGDWVVLPSKLKAAIHIGEIVGDYEFNPNAENPFYHSRAIRWFATDIPRSNFDQDILYSLGAFLTICRINRNNAEERIKQMARNGWTSSTTAIRVPTNSAAINESTEPLVEIESDIELLANDQIAKYLIQKFKGHGMARIVEAILKAKGYTTFCSPVGPDKGIDILAAPEPMGFGHPRICVQVKTSDTQIDRPTLDQLIGAMQNFKAT